jgi:predicted outer membrane repeat protein
MAEKMRIGNQFNSLISRFAKSRARRKTAAMRNNVGWAYSPTTSDSGGRVHPPYGGRGILEQLESRVLLSAITVTSLADDGGVNELRWAIQQANAAGGANTINFQSGLTGTIALNLGELELTNGNTTISGPGANLLAVSGSKEDRVFLVDSNVTGSISGLTIKNGVNIYATFDQDYAAGGGIENKGNLTLTSCTVSGNIAGRTVTDIAAYGGGIDNLGSLYVYSCAITGNSTFSKYENSRQQGGGISNEGTLVVTGSTFSSNSSSVGGAIAISDTNGGTGAGLCTILNSTFTGNTAVTSGGGVYAVGYDNLYISQSTFTNNNGNKGGGIAVADTSNINDLGESTFVITDSTVANNQGGGIRSTGNQATQNSEAFTAINCTITGNSNSSTGGGGIYITNQSTATPYIGIITNCTITNNSAKLGGGIQSFGLPLNINNTIVAANTLLDGHTASDIAGQLDVNLPAGHFASAYNLIGTGGSGGLVNGTNGNMVGVSNAMLGTLQNNGGPTETIALLPGSPAIDHGRNGLALDANGSPLTTDQRGTGFARIVDGTVDIGAYEGQLRLAFVAQPTTAVAGDALNPAVVVDVENENGGPLSGNGSAVTLSLLNGSLFGTVTVNAVNGVATFSNIVVDTVGTYQLNASDGTIPAVQSNSFTVNPNAPTQLVFAAEPTTAEAGAALSPSVVVYDLDAFGNIVRTDKSTVTLSVNTGPGPISGTASVALNNGAAIFSNILFNAPGTYTLIAQDGSRTAAVSTSFTVAPRFKLVFAAGPTNTLAGITLNPPVVVYLEDYQGNIIRTDTSKVSLLIVSGPGKIAGTNTVALNNGAAIFNNISFPNFGTYTISARDGTFAPVTSSAFTIAYNPNEVEHLVFIVNPTNIIAGAYIVPAFTVKATNAAGVAVGGVVVTIEISSGPAGAVISGKSMSTSYPTGIAAFGATTFQTAGTYTLTASVSGVVSAKSATFTVSPAAANKLAFTTLPASAKHGSAFTVKVSVEDAFGNILTSQNSGTITLALVTHPTGSTLGGTLTANVVNGVATFSNLTVNLAGTYSFNASDSFGIAAKTSATIVVG